MSGAATSQNPETTKAVTDDTNGNKANENGNATQVRDLEEDDEFEDFANEDWPDEETDMANGNDSSHLWEESWDDDDTSDDFEKMLAEEKKALEAQRNKKRMQKVRDKKDDEDGDEEEGGGVFLGCDIERGDPEHSHGNDYDDFGFFNPYVNDDECASFKGKVERKGNHGKKAAENDESDGGIALNGSEHGGTRSVSAESRDVSDDQNGGVSLPLRYK